MFTNPGWTEPGEYLISLGIPLGNGFDAFTFLKGKYTQAKNKLISTAFISDKGITGKNRLLNANFYGKLRYYMSPLVFPNKLIKAIESDANSFIWRRNPNLNADELGSSNHLGKWIAAKATYRPMKKGGAGLLSLKAHLKAYSAQWIRMLFEPRGACWNLIIDHWLPFPRGMIIANISHYIKKRILNSIPKQASLFRLALRNFWSLGIKADLNYIDNKIKEPDFVLSFPIFYNHLFTIKTRNLDLWALGQAWTLVSSF